MALTGRGNISKTCLTISNFKVHSCVRLSKKALRIDFSWKTVSKNVPLLQIPKEIFNFSTGQRTRKVTSHSSSIPTERLLLIIFWPQESTISSKKRSIFLHDAKIIFHDVSSLHPVLVVHKMLRGSIDLVCTQPRVRGMGTNAYSLILNRRHLPFSGNASRHWTCRGPIKRYTCKAPYM